MRDGANSRPVPCPRCGEGMRAALTKTAIWIGEDLFVVKDIPAQLCDSCLEQFYDDDVTEALRRLTEAEFPPEEAEKEITVRVYSLANRIIRYEPDAEEQEPAAEPAST
jgi:YgiT-type zinc finger domain-containing protein